MQYRALGRTGIKVSEIGIGGEGFENKTYSECKALIDYALENGINFIDIYNSNPDVCSHVGKALSRYPRDSFVVQGHICSMWENGQYRRTRNMHEVVTAYEDFLERMHRRARSVVTVCTAATVRLAQKGLILQPSTNILTLR